MADTNIESHITWSIDPVDFQPSTILYAEELNTSFNTTMKVVQGITEALGYYYGNDVASRPSRDINIETNADTVYEYIRKCLANLHVYVTEQIEDRIEIKCEHNYEGIHIEHKDLSSNNTHKMIFNNNGVKIDSNLAFKVETNGPSSIIEFKNNVSSGVNPIDNILKLTKNQNELLLNDQQVVYTKSADDLSENEGFVKKIWYDSSDNTIYFE